MNDKIKEYIEYCQKNGALNAVYFNKEDIVYDERTLLKCAFGCSDWGRNHTCPSASNFLGLEQYRKMLEKYKGGIIIHCADKHTSQHLSFQIESKAFVDGFYWAFSLSDCGLCKECLAKSDKDCANRKKARPAFHSVGIDVFATVKKFKLPLFTLASEREEQNWYSAVFID